MPETLTRKGPPVSPTPVSGERPAGAASSFRPDIQGLRAVAVVAVVADHVLHWPSGGFVGVDVVFVISGFLITGLLLREVERTGRISFGRFYARRVKRILPLAGLTLGATVLVAWLTFNSARFAATLGDAGWAAAFAANVRFEIVQTDYFQNQGPQSPLQHFWSLSVEEQFYFVWPAVMAVIVLLVRRRSAATGRAVFGVVMGLAILLSFTAAVVVTSTNAQGAYFSTATRAWELGVGALLAVAAPALHRLPQWLRPALLWAGLAGIVACCLLIDPTLPFPGPGAAVPVVATAAVIASGIGGRRPACPPLTNPVSRYLGDISYALYLWHFPVQIFLFDRLDGSWYRVPITLLLSFALAVASHHLIEQPILRSPWPTTGLSPHERSRSWARWRREVGPSVRRAALGSLAFTTALLVAAALVPPSTPRAPFVLPSAPPSTSEADTAGPATTKLQTEVRAALAATSWPTLDPTLEAILDGSRPGSSVLKCGSADERKLSQAECTWGPASAPTTAVLVGDSTAMHYLDPLVALAGRPDSGLRVANRAMFACPFVDVRIRNDTAGILDACAAHNAATLAYLDELKPDLVIVTNSYQVLDDDATGAPVTAAAWSTGMASYLERVTKTGAQVVSLAPPPDDADIASCYRPGSVPADCVTRTSKTWLTRLAADESDVRVRKGSVIDPRPWLCLTDLCPAFIGTTPVKEDRVHLTTAFALKLTDALGEALKELGYT